jgi:hypothetical protein
MVDEIILYLLITISLVSILLIWLRCTIKRDKEIDTIMNGHCPKCNSYNCIDINHSTCKSYSEPFVDYYVECTQCKERFSFELDFTSADNYEKIIEERKNATRKK